MASFQYNAKARTARIHFRYGGKQLNRVEPVESERHAQRIVALVEETIIDLERGKKVMPPDADPKTFILTGGKVERLARPVADPLHEATPVPSIGSGFDIYESTLTPGSKEANSIATEAIHARHFKRVLGTDRAFDSLAVDILQGYVDKRG